MGDTFIRHIALLGFEKRFVPSQHYVSSPRRPGGGPAGGPPRGARRGVWRGGGVAEAQVPHGAVPARSRALARRRAPACAPLKRARPAPRGPRARAALRPHPRPRLPTSLGAAAPQQGGPEGSWFASRQHSAPLRGALLRAALPDHPRFQGTVLREGRLPAALCLPTLALGSVTLQWDPLQEVAPPKGPKCPLPSSAVLGDWDASAQTCPPHPTGGAPSPEEGQGGTRLCHCKIFVGHL